MGKKRGGGGGGGKHKQKKGAAWSPSSKKGAAAAAKKKAGNSALPVVVSWAVARPCFSRSVGLLRGFFYRVLWILVTPASSILWCKLALPLSHPSFASPYSSLLLLSLSRPVLSSSLLSPLPLLISPLSFLSPSIPQSIGQTHYLRLRLDDLTDKSQDHSVTLKSQHHQVSERLTITIYTRTLHICRIKPPKRGQWGYDVSCPLFGGCLLSMTQNLEVQGSNRST